MDDTNSILDRTVILIMDQSLEMLVTIVLIIIFFMQILKKYIHACPLMILVHL